MAYSSHPYASEASSVRPLCDSQYRAAAIRAVNQAMKQLANSSLEAELARLHHEYKSKQVKLQESYLAAKAHANISIVSSSVTLPSTSPVVFPTRSRQFSNSLHSQAPIAAPSVPPVSNSLPPSHQKSCVTLLPRHTAQHSYPVHEMHYLPSTSTLPGISVIPSTSYLSQDNFYPSQGFSTVYPNVPMSQGYSNSQFPFSQPLSDSVSISSHPPNSRISNSVHVDTSVPPPSFPPTHNMDCRLPMVHKTANPISPHYKLNELVPSNISINVSSSSSSGSTIEPNSASQVSSLDSQHPPVSNLVL